MRLLSSTELDFVTGGQTAQPPANPPPTCTTNGSTTTCSCPEGSKAFFTKIDGVLVMICGIPEK